MRTPTRIRRTAARIATGTLLTTLALGLVAAPGLAEEVAPATPGPHTIPESPILPEDMDLPAPEEPGFSCKEWRELHEIFPGLPWADTPECPVEEDEADEDGSGPAFPVDEIPLPDGIEEIPVPFDPGEVPLPLDPGGATDDEEDETPEEEDTGGGSDDPDDASEGVDDAEDTGDDESRDTEVEDSSTEAGSDASGATAAGSDETPIPTRVDAGAGGSVLTVDRQDAILVAGLVLALGMVVTGGVLLARSTRA